MYVNVLERKITKICKSAGLAKIRLHGFRHSHAALLIDNHVEIAAIKELMGTLALLQQLTLTDIYSLMSKRAWVINLITSSDSALFKSTQKTLFTFLNNHQLLK
ncbi:hypothetical protein [Listeria booriae]|uniref:hypothetical protein n=1 Tax=Listeria booriae TaxID=1552123 RepID=UPI0035E3E31E